MVYGSPGAGKTTLAAQANDHPALAPALFLSFEGGLLSVAHRGDIDEIKINSMRDLEDAYLALQRKANGYDHYKTVVIDSGSELYSLSLQESVDQRRNRPDPDMVEIGDYGRAGYQTVRLFRQFRDLPIHVITTAHPRFTYAQGANQQSAEPIAVHPSFSGQVANKMMGMFDFVWYLYTFDDNGEMARSMLTHKMGAYEAKTRGPNFQKAMGSVVENPNLPEIYDLLLRSESSSSGQYLTEQPESVIMDPVEEPEVPEPPAGNFEPLLSDTIKVVLHGEPMEDTDDSPELNWKEALAQKRQSIN